MVIAPLIVLAPPLLTSTNAPALLKPVPLIVTAFAKLIAEPFNCNAAPFEIIALEPLAPRALFFCALTKPDVIFVVPVKVFALAPDNTKVPTPPLFIVMLEPPMIPDKVN